MTGIPFGADATGARSRPRAILFDWDNTLVDSWATIHEALNFVMDAMGKPVWSLADTQARVRLSLRESFPIHFGERWEEARAIYLDRFQEIHLERLKPLPGREAMLRSLVEQGIFLGVVSNKTGAFLRREVACLGWSGFFGSIIGAGDAAADKPACEPVHHRPWRRAVSTPARMSGSSATPRSTWSAPATAAASACCSATRCRPTSLRGLHRSLRSPTRQPCSAPSRGCDSTLHAHLRSDSAGTRKDFGV